jgi:hypothetical protein
LAADILEFTPRISVRALSYRILSHGEFESYFEARALEILMAADAAWKERQHISRTTLCVLAFSGATLAKLPDTLKPPANKKDANWDALIRPDKRISTAISEFTYYLRRQNNGIKEENVIGMLLRIGLSPDDLDEGLIAELNDLGVKRGEVAHGGASGSVSKGVNPRDEHEQVERICEGILLLDETLTKLLHAAR